MSDAFDIDPTLTGDARVAREITTKIGRALTRGGKPVKVGEIEDDILKAIAAARSAALEEAAKVAQDDTSFMMLQDFGMQSTCTQVRENIAAAIRELKDK